VLVSQLGVSLESAETRSGARSPRNPLAVVKARPEGPRLCLRGMGRGEDSLRDIPRLRGNHVRSASVAALTGRGKAEAGGYFRSCGAEKRTKMVIFT
jgi:hypothetical protein